MTGAGGSPRRVCPPDEELIELGQDLVKWATEETDELRCRFPQWYCLKQGIQRDHWDLIIAKPEFKGYYEKARVALSRRFIDGSVNPSIAHRFLRIYAPEVREEEESTADREAVRSKEIASAVVDPEAHKEILKLNELLKEAQKERKSSRNKSSPE